jgi:hypothetical protein
MSDHQKTLNEGERTDLTEKIQTIISHIQTHDFEMLNRRLFFEGRQVTDKLIYILLKNQPKRAIKILWETGILETLVRSTSLEKISWLKSIFRNIIVLFPEALNTGDIYDRTTLGEAEPKVDYYQIDNNDLKQAVTDRTDYIRIFPEGRIEVSFILDDGASFQYSWPALTGLSTEG